MCVSKTNLKGLPIKTSLLKQYLMHNDDVLIQHDYNGSGDKWVSEDVGSDASSDLTKSAW